VPPIGQVEKGNGGPLTGWGIAAERWGGRAGRGDRSQGLPVIGVCFEKPAEEVALIWVSVEP